MTAVILSEVEGSAAALRPLTYPNSQPILAVPLQLGGAAGMGFRLRESLEMLRAGLKRPG